MPKYWTVYPSMYGAYVNQVDLRPLKRFARIGGLIFEAGNDVVSSPALTEEQIEDLIAARVILDSRRNFKYGSTPWETTYIQSWSTTDMEELLAGCQAGAPHIPWGHYHLPLTDMTKFSATGNWATLVSQNDSYVGVIAPCEVHLPDFYWTSTTEADCQKIVSWNLAECRRAIGDSAISDHIVPYLTWNRPNGPGGWNTPVPLEPESFTALLLSLYNEDITEFILWMQIDTADDADLCSRTIAAFADGIEKRNFHDRLAFDDRYRFFFEAPNPHTPHL